MCPISEGWGNNQPAFAANLHPGDPFHPALDNTALVRADKLELGRLPVVIGIRTIKFDEG